MQTRRTFLSLAAWTLPAAVILRAEPPADLLQMIRAATEALSNDDAGGFLGHFDRGMTTYADLRERVEGMLAAYEVGCTIEIVSDSGDDRAHTVDLDWLLMLDRKNLQSGRAETRRQIVKCRAERQRRGWKFTAIEPLDFFRY